MSRLLRKLKFIFISICLILIVGIIAVFGNFPFNKKTKPAPTSTQAKTENPDATSNTTNILLLGDNSDSMMIASIDKDNKDVNITPVENVSATSTSNKEELLNSIEKSTKITLDKFVKISMADLMNAVSVLGDITVDINSEDLKVINNLIPKFYAESMDDSKGEMELISSSGVQKINEYQAMAYATIIANDKDRQKEMLLSLIENIKQVDFAKYFELFNTMKPYVETNLTMGDMIKLVSSTGYKFE